MNYSDTYQTPALMFVICAMSAMAFVVCSYRWLCQSGKVSEIILSHGFERSIWQGQVVAFMFVMVVSIFIGLFDFYAYERPIQIYGELIILTFFFTVIFLLDKSYSIFSVLRAVREIMCLGLLCVLWWLVTVGFGLLIAQPLKLISVIDHENFNVIVIFISGALWNVPVLWGYYSLLHNSESRGALKDKGVHKFLWPVLLAYMVLLVPLVTQDMVNSDEWNETRNIKPMRQI